MRVYIQYKFFNIVELCLLMFFLHKSLSILFLRQFNFGKIYNFFRFFGFFYLHYLPLKFIGRTNVQLDFIILYLLESQVNINIWYHNYRAMFKINCTYI